MRKDSITNNAQQQTGVHPICTGYQKWNEVVFDQFLLPYFVYIKIYIYTKWMFFKVVQMFSYAMTAGLDKQLLERAAHGPVEPADSGESSIFFKWGEVLD